MKLWIKNRRKDGKYTVVYGWDNGVRRTKIITEETLKKDLGRIKEQENEE